jgi:hypothetical protein
MLIFKEGKYITTPRFSDEPVRHKILDFLGDVSLLGHGLVADVRTYKAGHRLNWRVTAELRKLLIAGGQESRTGAMVPLHPGDKSRFVRDVTVPDGTTLRPNQPFEKVWEIMNAGQHLWVGRVLTREGPCFGKGIISSPPRSEIPRTNPGSTVRIAVQLRAPADPGWYRAEWKMTNENGAYVLPNQHPLFVVIRVHY